MFTLWAVKVLCFLSNLSILLNIFAAPIDFLSDNLRPISDPFTLCRKKDQTRCAAHTYGVFSSINFKFLWVNISHNAEKVYIRGIFVSCELRNDVMESRRIRLKLLLLKNRWMLKIICSVMLWLALTLMIVEVIYWQSMRCRLRKMYYTQVEWNGFVWQVKCFPSSRAIILTCPGILKYQNVEALLQVLSSPRDGYVQGAGFP